MGDFLGDVMKAGMDSALGNPMGAIGDAMKGIEDLLGGGKSPQQVQQGLSQLDQALHLPPGTLENILKSHMGGQGQGGAESPGFGGMPMSAGQPPQANLSKEMEHKLKKALEEAMGVKK